jgi:hypothetical protein
MIVTEFVLNRNLSVHRAEEKKTVSGNGRGAALIDGSTKRSPFFAVVTGWGQKMEVHYAW